ncbi:broad specificity phosphatase PhoE [Humitalea rosea]|uniref:Broad specificity phosphatase PhoE n=1 Tax=Humitalea rosea TaxID=990373 RepID=A0A2W7IDU8_9PROT|nr:histidine phosphatase family protein [Humitalea rosea]PZW45070.1 broad specificity phosphatase PhoE [Humitalea rosea]
MSGTRFFLIRHALVEPSARAVLYGDMDVPLCGLSLLADAAAYRWLAGRLPAEANWVVTPLSRTHATAAAIFASDAGLAPQPLAVEEHLREQTLGEWQGLPHDEAARRMLRPAHPFWPHGADERPPGGESLADVVLRVGAVMERLAETHAGKDVVIVAHGGSIRGAVAHATGITPHQVLQFSIRNLSLTRLEKRGPDWRVWAVNEESGLASVS